MMSTCPCCGQAMQRPTVEAIASVAMLSRQQTEILAVLFEAARPLRAREIAERLWPDVEGEPLTATSIVKTQIHNLRRHLRALDAPEVSIEGGIGPNSRGYRLVIREAA